MVCVFRSTRFCLAVSAAAKVGAVWERLAYKAAHCSISSLRYNFRGFYQSPSNHINMSRRGRGGKFFAMEKQFIDGLANARDNSYKFKFCSYNKKLICTPFERHVKACANNL